MKALNAYRKEDLESIEGKQRKPKNRHRTDKKAHPKSQAPGTSGREKPPPPTINIIPE